MKTADPQADPGQGAPARLEPVAGSDGIWLQDSDANRMIINSVFTLERTTADEVRRLWQERVLGPDKTGRYDRFKTLITYRGRRPFWQRDVDFSLERQVLRANVGPIADDKSLQDFLSRLAGEPLPADRPLWQVQVVENFGENSSAVITRIHHVIGDGMALVPVIFLLMDSPSSEEGEGGDEASTGRRGSVDKAAKKKASRFARMIKTPLAAPLVLARKMLGRADKHRAHGPQLEGSKRVAWTRPISMDRVKSVKDAAQATVNDVLMSCVGGAFRRYLTLVAQEPIHRVRVSMPFNVRSLDEPPVLNNKFAAVMIDLPTHFDDVRDRLRGTKQLLDALKRSTEPLVMYGAASLMIRFLPQGASRRLIDFLANKCTCVVTNVPGPQEALALGGRRLDSMMFWVPQRAGIGIGLSIFSYFGQVQIGAICDTRLIPDPQLLVRAFEDEFEHFEAIFLDA